MTKTDLLSKLLQLNLSSKYYSLGNEIKEDAYNIERLYNGKYALYFLERGEKVGLKIFNTENEAIGQLIQSLEFNIKIGHDLSD